MYPMMTPTRCFQRVAAGVALLAALVAPAWGMAPNRSDSTPWVAPIQKMDEALARGDISAAVRAWHDAYLAALGARRWEGMAAVGDASMRLAALPDSRRAMEAEARRCYLAALFRARHQRSIDGVLQIAEAFAALGDRGAARQALVIASAMTGGTPQTEIAERMRVLREWLEGRAPARAGARSGESVAGFAQSVSAD